MPAPPTLRQTVQPAPSLWYHSPVSGADPLRTVLYRLARAIAAEDQAVQAITHYRLIIESFATAADFPRAVTDYVFRFSIGEAWRGFRTAGVR